MICRDYIFAKKKKKCMQQEECELLKRYSELSNDENHLFVHPVNHDLKCCKRGKKNVVLIASPRSTNEANDTNQTAVTLILILVGQPWYTKCANPMDGHVCFYCVYEVKI